MTVEANAILQRQHAAVILARQQAIKAVRRQRQKQGLRETLPMSVLSRLAREWLDDHPALLAEAAASPILQNLQLAHRKRRPRNQALPLCETHERNGGPEQ
jgi:hypothetical protein